MKQPPSKVISFKVPIDLLEKLDRLTENDFSNRSSTIRKCINRYYLIKKGDLERPDFIGMNF